MQESWSIMASRGKQCERHSLSFVHIIFIKGNYDLIHFPHHV